MELKEIKLLAEEIFRLQFKMLKGIQELEFNDAIEFKIWYGNHPYAKELEKIGG